MVSLMYGVAIVGDVGVRMRSEPCGATVCSADLPFG